MTLTITTYDWVPEFPRGYVRDIRARWACEEAGLAYGIDTVPLKPKTDAHLARQPFGQVPMLKDGEVAIFESGAILLHLAEKSEALMPRDPAQRAQVVQWVIAALNSIEMWTVPWLVAKVFKQDAAAAAEAAKQMDQRLGQLAKVLEGRAFLVGDRFTAADIMMADVLRTPGDEGALDGFPVLADYVARMTARPAFAKVHAEQVAEFEAADAARKENA